MKSTIVGGAMLPHAPQFFTMPDTEDRRWSRQSAKSPQT
jgi:2,3-dihydroxyphenylpropionate 1,2-dioxygenase